jgi:hypothetical protein
MDLIALALARKNSGSGGGGTSPSYDDLIPSIGDNGHWYIKGKDTGISAVPKENVQVDGVLKADATKQNIVVLKDGTETIVGEFTTGISSNSITELFEEG